MNLIMDLTINNIMLTIKNSYKYLKNRFIIDNKKFLQVLNN